MIDAINELAVKISGFIWGWPLIILFAAFGVVATIYLYFAQFRFFLDACKLVLFPPKTQDSTGEMTPFQAFINTLGTGTGNGSLAGISTGIYAGGPGAAFWLVIAGFFAMILRFCEVYISTAISSDGLIKGGPMVFLKKVPGKKFLPGAFALFMLLFGLSTGNAMQVNSIALSIFQTWNISAIFSAIALALFVIYVLSGGAPRIIKISDKLVPFKVGLFFICFLMVLIYHYQSFFPALKLILNSAFCPRAIGGAAAGFSVQQMIRAGFSRSLNATEAGLGSASVLFGAVGSKHPMRDSIMSLVAMFISALVCFMVALSLVASGVWNNGLQSTPLTISAFNTVFGQYGGWFVSFLAISFGCGVLVPYVFICRESWIYLTNNRYLGVFFVLFAAVSFFGSLAKVNLIWNLVDIFSAILFLINLYAIIYFLPFTRKGIQKYMAKKEDA